MRCTLTDSVRRSGIYYNKTGMNTSEQKNVVRKPKSGSPLCTTALILSIIAIILAGLGFFPCLGVITLTAGVLLAVIALTIGIYAACRRDPIGPAVMAGIALVVALVAGIVQLYGMKYVWENQDDIKRIYHKAQGSL